MVVGIYALAVVVSALFPVPTTAAFLTAALAICLLKLIPADEAYRAIDLPVLVLLAAMIPIGREFNEAGGSDAIAGALSAMLGGAPLFLALLVLGTVTMLLTIFLNNIATSIVMAQVGIEFALALAIPPDAALIAVLICCSCDFLTPIGHQNNLIVMRPGGYRFMDYPKVGAPLSLIVVVGSAWILSAIYG
jgi:di/tricarboxylate transporter